MPSQGQNKISIPVIRRLPRYYRHIQSLKDAGVTTVSSSELATILGTTASQVRQDFNCFGGFGQQGVGYNVELLAHELQQLLIGGEPLPAILIGTGRLGRALAHFIATEAQGFALAAAFDKADAQVGSALGQLAVRHVDELATYCHHHAPQLAVLCVPQQSAATLAPILPGLGIKGVWNFSHHDFSGTGDGMTVENVHLGDSLQSLGYRVRNPLPGSG